MKTFASFLLPVLSLSATATAFPAQVTRQDAPEGPPVPGKVTFCTGTEASGVCESRVVNFEECNPVPEQFVKNTGSFIIAAGTICRGTLNGESVFNCNMDGDFALGPPGNPNMFEVNGTDIGHSMTSFFCESCADCQTN